MREPCNGCAFTTGAAANLEPANAVRSTLTVLGGMPFYCHIKLDWQNNPELRKSDLRGGHVQVCAGWKREVAKLNKIHYYPRDPRRRAYIKHIAILGMVSLRTFIDGEGFAKQNAVEELKIAINRLVRRKEKFSEMAKRRERVAKSIECR